MSIAQLDVSEDSSTSQQLSSSRRIWCCNLHMIPAKLSYFGMSGMVGSYGYFTNIFLREVGLAVEETGLISGLTYVVLAFVSPLWGLLIDFTGRRKLFFGILFGLMATCVFSLPFVAYVINPINKNITNATSVQSTNVEPADSRAATFSSSMFFAMLALEIAGKVFTSPLQAMVDAAVMNVITTKEPSATFGNQRLYGGLAFGSMAFVSGAAIDHFASYFERLQMSKYTSAFFLFLLMACFTVVACLTLINQMDLTVTKEGQEGQEGMSQKHLIIQTFSNFKNVLFLITCLMVGICNMTLVGYLYMLMKDKMNSNKSMMGLSSLVQSIVQVIIFPFADKIVELVGGPINAMAISLFSYFIRFLANSFITNAVVAVIIQSFHATCFSLFWVAAVVYTQKIAPKGIYVTMFTLVNGVYYGLGGIIANMLGGIVYGKFGGRILFRGMSVVCLSWTIILMVLFHQDKLFGIRNTSQVQPEDTVIVNNNRL